MRLNLRIFKWAILYTSQKRKCSKQLDLTFNTSLCSENAPSPRTEVLHHIDPDVPLKGENTYPDIFDVRVQAALTNGFWKILTGDQGEGIVSYHVINYQISSQSIFLQK